MEIEEEGRRGGDVAAASSWCDYYFFFLAAFFAGFFAAFFFAMSTPPPFGVKVWFPFRCCISDFLHRVKCLPSDISDRRGRGPGFRTSAEGPWEGILWFEDVNSVWLQPLEFFNAFCANQSPGEARWDAVACFIEMWVCRRGTLFRVLSR